MNQTGRIEELARAAREASRELAKASPRMKNDFLLRAASLLQDNMEPIIAANGRDLSIARDNGMDEWRLDRMRVTSGTIGQLVAACGQIAAMPDPVGAMDMQWQRPNGLLVGRMRVPIGVVCMIYEARPAVTIDAAILAIKAGNAIILRGGSGCAQTNGAFMDILSEALKFAGLPEGSACQACGGHDVVDTLCRLDEYIDLLIPRGGEKLVGFVRETARMPVLMHYKGVCHAYVDRGADLEQALDIIENSKTQRPGVCNALECLLVNQEEAGRFLPLLAQRLAKHDVQFRADPVALPFLGPNAAPLGECDLGREFLAQVLAVCVVRDMDDALEHIARYGSRHTDIICTRDYARAMRFLREADSSMVAVNASTRFNDGGELGLGAEIGISTCKLHAYGPMGVKELTTTKFVVFGSGQIRS